MAMLCFFDEDRQASFKARSQAESLIKLFTKLAFEELGIKDVFLRTCRGRHGRKLAYTLFVSSASTAHLQTL